MYVASAKSDNNTNALRGTKKPRTKPIATKQARLDIFWLEIE